MSALIDAPRQSNQQNLLRATIIAAIIIITTAATPDLIQIVARLSSRLSRYMREGTDKSALRSPIWLSRVQPTGRN